MISEELRRYFYSHVPDPIKKTVMDYVFYHQPFGKGFNDVYDFNALSIDVCHVMKVNESLHLIEIALAYIYAVRRHELTHIRTRKDLDRKRHFSTLTDIGYGECSVCGALVPKHRHDGFQNSAVLYSCPNGHSPRSDELHMFYLQKGDVLRIYDSCGYKNQTYINQYSEGVVIDRNVSVFPKYMYRFVERVYGDIQNNEHFTVNEMSVSLDHATMILLTP